MKILTELKTIRTIYVLSRISLSFSLSLSFPLSVIRSLSLSLSFSLSLSLSLSLYLSGVQHQSMVCFGTWLALYKPIKCAIYMPNAVIIIPQRLLPNDVIVAIYHNWNP